MQGAAFGAAALVKYHQRDVADVIGGGVPQQEELHDGDEEDDRQGALVAKDLDEFLADDGAQTNVHALSFSEPRVLLFII